MIKLKKRNKIIKSVSKNNIKGYKKSITAQMVIIFAVIMLATVFVCIAINSLFLEKYYFVNKKNAILSAYNRICSAAEENGFETEQFDVDMQRYVASQNLSIVIINSRFELTNVYSNEAAAKILMDFQNNLMGMGMVNDVLYEGDDYVIVMKNDKNNDLNYLEMWGLLSDGSFFMMRTAVESIHESAIIANRFLLYVGIISAFISTIIIFFFSKRITKPILEIADISEKMADMDFNAKYNGKNKDEIGLLGRNINSMSEKLEKTISELKEANLELVKDNENKKEIDEMRKEFISNVSHELKTPIALIQGYAEGLKEGLNEAEERDYYCDVIMDEASKMNTMVKRLLDLNRLEFGHYDVSLEHFDIGLLVRNYVQSSDIILKQNNITVSLPENEVMVWADEFMIEEVFNNYFSNAINHCESDKEKRIDVSIEMHENVVRVFVYNTGNPIPEESLEHLWEKFYKVDKARTRAYGGSGVGLSIVKAIMDAHNQKYGVENCSDGVRFWFELDASN